MISYQSLLLSTIYLMIAGTGNSTGTYIVIMASLQALVNSLLVWQSSCENKLRPLNFPDAC